MKLLYTTEYTEYTEGVLKSFSLFPCPPCVPWLRKRLSVMILRYLSSVLVSSMKLLYTTEYTEYTEGVLRLLFSKTAALIR